VNTGDKADTGSALDWSVSAMRDATGRLQRGEASEKARAFVVIGEAVWWVTIVDSTLVRYHPEIYDSVLANQPSESRRLTEGTLAGLRFVRNRMGHEMDDVDFIQLGPSGTGATGRSLAVWRWNLVPEPALETLGAPARSWEVERYRAYSEHLAGRSIAETFARAVKFLNLAAERAAAVTDPADPARP